MCIGCIYVCRLCPSSRSLRHLITQFLPFMGIVVPPIATRNSQPKVWLDVSASLKLYQYLSPGMIKIVLSGKLVDQQHSIYLYLRQILLFVSREENINPIVNEHFQYIFIKALFTTVWDRINTSYTPASHLGHPLVSHSSFSFTLGIGHPHRSLYTSGKTGQKFIPNF